MNIFRTIAELKGYVRAMKLQGRTIGFVPTMGFLHEGHLSLLKASKQQADVTVLSIFVNPLQFGPNEDFERYPRNEASDLELAASAEVEAVFLPSVQGMYPGGNHTLQTRVTVSGVSERLCGASRPGHFDGVATVVMKLFGIVQPDYAFFGLKDAQQVAVIEQMAADLNVPLHIVPCPTLREADGLAMSSRNVYLTKTERAQAVILHESLELAASLIRNVDGLNAADLESQLRAHIGAADLAQIDYIEVLSYPSLQPLQGSITNALALSRVIVAFAVKFGSARLIDNRIFVRTQEGGIQYV